MQAIGRSLMKHALLCLGVIGLASLTSQAVAATASGSLRVGAARVDITPAGEAASSKYDHERLYIRAIVLDNGVTRGALIGADQGGIAEEIWQDAGKKIAAELGAPVENVIMSATHTHSAAGRGPNGQQAPVNVQAIVGSMLDAVRQAKAALQPARMGYGTGLAYLNVNRDAINPETHLWTQAPNLNATSDKTVAVLKFETTTGQPIAAYVNYAMHPVNGYLSGFTSADFAGAMSRYVEQAYNDRLVAVFTQGASGDQNPLYLRASTNVMASKGGVPITGNVLVREDVESKIRGTDLKPAEPDPKFVDRLKHSMEAQGTILGEEVIRVMTDTMRMSTTVRIWGAQKIASCPGRTRTNTGREGMPGTYVDGDPVNIRLGLLGIGDVALTTVNAEVYNLIAQRAKKQSPMTNTMVVTLANGRANSGYIPDDASFSHNSFQVLGSRLKPGCAESALADGLSELVSQYARQ
jgi:neutral ceramidase